MSAMPDSTFVDPQQVIINLQQQLADTQRLLNQRTAERDEAFAERNEALAQQAATAEVLQVINSSPGDLAPVFDEILEKATRLCETAFGVLWTYDGELYHAAGVIGPSALAEFFMNRPPLRPAPISGLGRHIAGEDIIQIADLASSELYAQRNPGRHAYVELGSARTAMSVALRKDGALFGAVQVFRQEVRPFSDKQIALLQNFAAQAVIAMENAQLLNELRDRTSDLQESLEYQTATSNVLKIISRSTFDLQPALETVVQTATQLCNADIGGLFLPDGKCYKLAASFASSPEYDSLLRARPLKIDRRTLTGRTVLEARVVHISDIAADPEYGTPEAVTMGKVRTALGVPLLRQGDVIGVISLGRQRVEPFSERQIELVRTFADQAVIAIENARLLTELREVVGAADGDR